MGYQEKYYSGEKKNHTFKNQIITTPKGTEIVDVIVGEKGPVSDVKILRKQQDKFENKEKARKRIFVEHVIRLIKIFGIARERFRLKDNNYQKLILTICGLVRLRIGYFILV